MIFTTLSFPNYFYDLIRCVEPAVARALAGKKTLQGNLDPSILYAPPDVLRSETDKMVDAFGTQRYIANLGHGMLPSHDPDQVGIFMEQIHVRSAANAGTTYVTPKAYDIPVLI
jgi:uroporphyrinogen-III decarboxylase